MRLIAATHRPLAAMVEAGTFRELPDALARGRRRSVARFDDAVRAAIEDALRTTRGKLYGRGGAAEMLGLDPGTLQSKMRKLGIVRAEFT